MLLVSVLCARLMNSAYSYDPAMVFSESRFVFRDSLTVQGSRVYESVCLLQLECQSRYKYITVKPRHNTLFSWTDEIEGIVNERKENKTKNNCLFFQEPLPFFLSLCDV